MASVGKDRPNLKICIDNTEEPSDPEGTSESEDDPFDTEIQIHGLGGGESDDEFEISVSIDEKSLPKTSSKKPALSLGPIHYENKAGNFTAGIDVTTEKEQEKKILRGKRFGIQTTGPAMSDDELNKLYESLGIDSKKLQKNERGIRLDVIHMKGTDEMNTKDVYQYFKEFRPSSVDWIDDGSCNVVWRDEITAARALIKLSSKYNAEDSDSSSSEDEEENMEQETENKEESMETDESSRLTANKSSTDNQDESKPQATETNKEEKDNYDELDLMSTDDEEDKETGEKERSPPENKENETDEPENAKNAKDEMSSEKSTKEASKDNDYKTTEDERSSHTERKSRVRHRHRRKSPLSLPPGHWRIGVPCLKAKHIFLRYATKADKKLPGAERRSKYYQKHDNPDSGVALSIKGILTETKKKKFKNDGWKNVNDEVLDELEGMAAIEPELDDNEFDEHLATVERERKQAAINRRLKEKGQDPDPPPLPLPEPVSRKRKYEEPVYIAPFYSEEEEEEEEEYFDDTGDLEEGEVVDSEEESVVLPVNIEETDDGEKDEEINLQLQLKALLEPPQEKRFMRMHADDEEEKIIAKRKKTKEKVSTEFVHDARSRIKNRKRDQMLTDDSPPRNVAGDLRSRIGSRRRERDKTEKLPKLTVEVTQDDDSW